MLWEWLAAIGWSAGSVAGGIALYRRVRFFSGVWGIITIAAIGVVSGALHNFLNALFSIDEPFFFLLAIFGIGMTPILVAQWLFERGFHLYRQWITHGGTDRMPGMNDQTLYADVNGIRIAYERGGSGYPLLLIHGYPETRRMWRQVAAALTARFDVVSMDLRGYGDSDRPSDELSYDKRTMAEDAYGLATHLGWDKFLVAGHDRGGRTARRLAADHSESVVGATLLDILPLEWVYNQGKDGYAQRYWHWYFHLQRGLAERLINSDPSAYVNHLFARRGDVLDPENVAHYMEVFARPGSVNSTLADYRTAFDVDRPRWTEEVAAGHKITVPLQILWGEYGNLNDEPTLEIWREVAEDVRGEVIPGSGHYIPEEQPETAIRLINAFADELGL